ncbi:MAG: GntR family transcriptional regulator [Pseudomonadota bacterium]
MASTPAADQPEGAKARRVYLLLRTSILEGTYPVSSSLPGEQRLCDQFDVSRVTVRRALDSLARDKLIEKRVGSGSIVLAAPAASIAADFTSLMPQLVEMTERTTARLLSFAYGAAPVAVARGLSLKGDERVQTAVRVRLLGEVPFSHLTTHVPEAIARNYSEADLATTPLFRLLERGGVVIDAATQSVTATLAAPDVADALGVAVGSALLSLTRIVRDDQGQGVEYLSALYRPDTFRLEMALHRAGQGDARYWEPVIGEAASEAAE